MEAAQAAAAGVFLLVRTSNPGAARLQDASLAAAPPSPRGSRLAARPRMARGRRGNTVHEALAALVAEPAPELAGESGLSGVGAVVGATAPQHLGRLRELMPDSIFLVPGIGAQGGRPEDLGPGARVGPPGLGPGSGLAQHRRRRGPGRRRPRSSAPPSGRSATRAPGRPEYYRAPRMPDYKPNQFVRAFAVMALAGGLRRWSSRSSRPPAAAPRRRTAARRSRPTGPNKRGRAAVKRGVWIVRSGDTLGKISEETGVDIDTLIQLNPDLDPQALLEGQRIALR